MPTRVRSADTERSARVVLHDLGVTSTCFSTVRLLFLFCFFYLPVASSPFHFSHAISSRIYEASQPIHHEAAYLKAQERTFRAHTPNWKISAVTVLITVDLM